MLPKMNDKFSAFIAPAEASRGGLRFAIALIMLVLFYGALSLQIFVVFAVLEMVQTGLDFGTAFTVMFVGLANPTTPQDMIAVLITFFAMLGSIWIIVMLFRRHGLRQLIGPGPVLRNFCIAALVMLPLIGVSFGLGLWSGDATSNLPIGTWLLWLGLALPLLLIQVSSEELIFRGYLMQELAIRFKARWVWLLLPSLIFGCLHFDPARFGTNAYIIIAVTTLFGIIAADVTVRTGNLGAAIGLHFMNNFQAMLLLSLNGTLNGLSLFVTKTHVSDHETVRSMLLTSAASIAVIYVIYLIVVTQRERRLLQSQPTPFT